jgi:hypothetical protein
MKTRNMLLVIAAIAYTVAATATITKLLKGTGYK